MRPLSPEADEARSVAQPSHPAKSAHKVLTPDLVNSHYHVAFRECSSVISRLKHRASRMRNVVGESSCHGR